MKEAKCKNDSDNSAGQLEAGEYSGTMIVDATCASPNIWPLRMFHCSMRSEKTLKNLCISFVILRRERKPIPTPDTLKEIT